MLITKFHTWYCIATIFLAKPVFLNVVFSYRNKNVNELTECIEEYLLDENDLEKVGGIIIRDIARRTAEVYQPLTVVEYLSWYVESLVFSLKNEDSFKSNKAIPWDWFKAMLEEALSECSDHQSSVDSDEYDMCDFEAQASHKVLCKSKNTQISETTTEPTNTTDVTTSTTIEAPTKEKKEETSCRTGNGKSIWRRKRPLSPETNCIISEGSSGVKKKKMCFKTSNFPGESIYFTKTLIAALIQVYTVLDKKVIIS